MFKRILLTSVIILLASCAKPLTESEVIEKAQTAYDAGDSAQAQFHLKTYLVAQPESQNARAFFAEILTEQGNYLEAASQFDKTKTSLLTNAQIDLLFEAKYFLESMDEVFLVSELLTTQQLSESSQLFLAINQVRTDKDTSKLDAIISTSSYSAAAVEVAKSTLAYSTDFDTPKFIEKVETAISGSFFENNWFLISLLANTNSSIANYERAAYYFTKLADMRPAHTQTKLFLAVALLKNKDVASADKLTSQILEAFPKQPIANHVKAMVYLEKNDWINAKNHFETSIANGYQIRENYLLAGTVNFLLEGYEQAINHLERGLVGIKQKTIYLDMLAFSKAKSRNPAASVDVLISDFPELSNVNTLKSAAFALSSVGAQTSLITLFQDPKLTNQVDSFQHNLLKAEYVGLDDQSTANLLQGIKDESIYDSLSSEQTGRAKLAILRKYHADGNINAARELAKQWYEDTPNNADSAILYADSLQTAKQHKQALAILSKLIDEKYDNYIIYKMQTWSLYELGQIKEALASAKVALSMRKYDLSLLRQYAFVRSQLSLGEPDAWINTIYTDTSNIESQAILLSMYHSMTGNFEQALSSLKSLPEDSEKSIVYYYTIAETYLKLGDEANARSNILTASRTALIPLQAIVGISNTMDKLGTYNEALTMLDRQIINYPGAEDLLIIASDVLVKLGRFDSAISYLDRVKTKKALALSKESDILLRQGQMRAGVKKLQSAFEQSDDTFMGLKLATTMLQLGNKRQATAVVKQLADKEPNNVDVKILIAATSSNDKAQSVYKDIIKSNPNHGVALNNLAWLLYEGNNASQGLEYAKRAIQIAPDNENFQDTLNKINEVLANTD